MFTSKELDLLTLCITAYKREIEDDVLTYRSFESKSKDVTKRIDELQSEFFALVELWNKCYKLEREVKEAEQFNPTGAQAPFLIQENSMRPMKNVLKFQLEFMLMMHMSGREEEANSMLQRLFQTIDRVEGEYVPQQLELDLQ